MVLQPDNLNENENLGTESNQQESSDNAENVVPETNVAPEQEEEVKTQPDSESEDVAVDYSVLSKEGLCSKMEEFAQAEDALQFKNDAEEVKNSFYKIHRTEIAEKKKAFVEDGGLAEDFSFEDKVEQNFKEFYKQYRDRKAWQIESIEKERKANLNKKKEIIAEIESLINKEESINNTFNDFRALQEAWKEVGPVSQTEIKTIWESYHLAVGKFYDYIKINKELRDLDLKKNLEQKIALCEQAERLLLEESVVKAFGELQKLHENWREVGPTPNESKEEIWERFKVATSTINKRHQDYFVQLKEQEKRNLEAKKAICEKIKELIDSDRNTPRQWTDASNEVVELQKVWRTIGFAPKKYNNEIYAEFRALCDEFFSEKKTYFDALKLDEENNKQKKIDLCIQAEALSTSTDWKSTTAELIRLQKEWKESGNVARKDSEKLWKRFRGACDVFFVAKDAFFKGQDAEQEENLAKKKDIVERIKNMDLGSDHEADLKQLMAIQKEWSEIGFVPLKEKNSLQASYREALDAKFAVLNIENDSAKSLKYKIKLESFKVSKNPRDKFAGERNRIQTRIKQLQGDITTLENNIGFFSNSNNASSFIKDVEKKIQKGQDEIAQLKEQLKLINEVDS